MSKRIAESRQSHWFVQAKFLHEAAGGARNSLQGDPAHNDFFDQGRDVNRDRIPAGCDAPRAETQIEWWIWREF